MRTFLVAMKDGNCISIVDLTAYETKRTLDILNDNYIQSNMLVRSIALELMDQGITELWSISSTFSDHEIKKMFDDYPEIMNKNLIRGGERLYVKSSKQKDK